METMTISEKLHKKIVKQIIKYGPIEVYWDQGQEIELSTITEILQKDSEYPLNDLENDIDERNDFWYDLQIEGLERALGNFEFELKSELYPKEDDDFEIDYKELAIDLRDEFMDYICIDTNLKSLLPDIPIRIELFSNYDCINSHWFESMDGYSFHDTYFGDAVKQLKLDPQKVKGMLKHKGVKICGSWPKHDDSQRLIEYETFWQEIQNRSCGANLLCIVGMANGYEFLNNYHKGIVEVIIPKGNNVGFFSSFQGGGSTIEAPLLRDVKIKIHKPLDKSGYTKWGLSVDSGSYSINDAYGVTNEFWGSELKFKRKKK